MKRSTLLIFITFAALVLAFSAYLFLVPQSDVAHHAAPLEASGHRPTTRTGSLGAGQGAWVKQFDERTGNISSQFRGASYDRQSDESIRVVKPEAEFFLSDGQVLKCVGETGIIRVPETLRPGKDAAAFSGPTKPPTRGDLQSVEIRLLPSQTATTPTLVCTMDNATFDNETFRIFTHDATIDGKPVPADQIPISLHGVDYDFDGRGLTIRLNQRDRRLEYLEITHGEHLTIKNPSKLNDAVPGAGIPAAGKPSARTLPNSPLPVMYAQTGPVAPPAHKKPAIPATDAGPAIYRASFQENVRVVQGAQDLAKGDELQIDFLFEDSRPDKPKKSKTSTNNATRSTSPAATAPDTATAPSPATRPAQQPVTIYWTGKLTLLPIPPTPDAPGHSDSIVRITGAPMVVSQGAGSITGHTMMYRTGTQQLALRGADNAPLVLDDGKGAKVHGTSIDYSQKDRFAVLDGPGSALKTLPAGAPGQAPKELAANWSRSATLYFTGEPNEPMRIESAKLDGAVGVKHPQLSLTAQTLKLDFDASPTTRPTDREKKKPGEPGGRDFAASDLRHLEAAGGVRSTVIGSNGRPQSITAQTLTLDTASTPDGQLYPHKLAADGSVHAYDADQELKAGHLRVTLSPQTKSAIRNPKSAVDKDSVPVELEHLSATDSVTINTADGVAVSADRLDVDVEGAEQNVRLLGTPARVASKENVVVGPYIEIHPLRQTYSVRGPGNMHFVQQQDAKSKPRPVDVTWKDSVNVDGKKNTIDVAGGVFVTTVDDKGEKNTSSSELLTMTLMDNPQAAATTKKAPTTRRKSDPITGIAAQGDPLQNKVVQTITLKQGVSLESVQNAKGGELLRQMNLQADVVSYDMAHKRFTVPVPGRMLFVNRPPADAAKTANDPTDLGGSRGNTAFAWQQQMVYDQSAQTMTMTGDVVIAHEPTDDKGGQQSFRLDADSVKADLIERKDATHASAAPAGAPSSVDLKHVHADGAIRFTSKESSLTAWSVDYDPATGMLTARGQGREPVRLYTADGVPAGAADEITFNAKTGKQMTMKGVQARTGRR